jgi:hypothetical protein
MQEKRESHHIEKLQSLRAMQKHGVATQDSRFKQQVAVVRGDASTIIFPYKFIKAE